MQVEAPPVKPLLRGWLHLACFFLSIPAGVVLIMRATAGARGGCRDHLRLRAHRAVRRQRGLSPSAMVAEVAFALQATRSRTIFVMIAGTSTPLCLVVFGGVLGTAMLASVWAGAIAGVVLATVGIAERRFIGGACDVVLGWVAVGRRRR